jgi:thermostable 8-oxoguanine DNA glycosylase
MVLPVLTASLASAKSHDNAKSTCEFKKLSKNMGDKLNKEMSRCVLLSTSSPSTLISSLGAIWQNAQAVLRSTIV